MGPAVAVGLVVIPAKRKNTQLRWPNVHEWALIGFFLITFSLLWMMRENPSLLAVVAFMQFASQITGGGLLLAAAWLFSNTKTDSAGGVPDVNVKGDSVTVEKESKTPPA